MIPSHKTKIVATIGPASESPEMIERLMRAGMNIARLNFSHGDPASHAAVIQRIRAAEKTTGHQVAIMADLPGPKIRIGMIEPEVVQLVPGEKFTLTTREIVGGERQAFVSLPQLPRTVRRGDRLFLNDGLIQLVVDSTSDTDVECTIAVGGELRSRKGLNLPGIHLGMCAFTEEDRAWLEFAIANDIDAISQSFVEEASDIAAVREAATHAGGHPFIVAKIERAGALTKIDEILAAADGIMVARGDLGVEVPIEEIAIIQKDLLARAGAAGKPAITATQMLESMVTSRLPTRAEATDVANAILDGTDAVMLSAESAIGQFPEEAVAMLGRIAAVTERRRPAGKRIVRNECDVPNAADAIACITEEALANVPAAAVFVPTRSGRTARMISRSKPRAWIVAISEDDAVCDGLMFSYGVMPMRHSNAISDWREFATRWLRENHVQGDVAMLVAGPSSRNPHANHRIEFIRAGD
jgi:pyruvate kinase